MEYLTNVTISLISQTLNTYNSIHFVLALKNQIYTDFSHTAGPKMSRGIVS